MVFLQKLLLLFKNMRFYSIIHGVKLTLHANASFYSWNSKYPWGPLMFYLNKHNMNIFQKLCGILMRVSDSLRPHGLYLPGSSVHGILQARILEWVAVASSRESSQPRDQMRVSCRQADSLPLSCLGSSPHCREGSTFPSWGEHAFTATRK